MSNLIRSIFFTALVLIVGMASTTWGKTLTIKVKCLRPVDMRFVYYTLKDVGGKTLAYHRVSGRKALDYVELKSTRAPVGDLRLDSSWGTFKGYYDGEGVSFSHPHIRQEGDQLTILNQYSLVVTLRTFSPVERNKVQYLLLSKTGSTLRRIVAGSDSHKPAQMILRNVLPGPVHFATSFGQFAARLEEDRLVFAYRGSERVGVMRLPLPGGRNYLYIQAKVSTDPDVEPVEPSVPKGGGRVVIDIPAKVEVDSPRGAVVRLDGRKSNVSSQAQLVWTYPGGKVKGRAPEVELARGKHTISLGVVDKGKYLTAKKTIEVVDNTPPEVTVQFQPLRGGSQYRLQVQVWDRGDPSPQYSAYYPVTSDSPQLEKGAEFQLVWSDRGVIHTSVAPEKSWQEIRKKGGLVLDLSDVFEVTPTTGPFTATLVSTGRWRLSGKIPPLVVEARDNAGNRVREKVPFRLVLGEAEKPPSTSTATPESRLSALEVLVSVVVFFLFAGILFLRPSPGP